MKIKVTIYNQADSLDVFKVGQVGSLIRQGETKENAHINFIFNNTNFGIVSKARNACVEGCLSGDDIMDNFPEAFPEGEFVSCVVVDNTKLILEGNQKKVLVCEVEVGDVNIPASLMTEMTFKFRVKGSAITYPGKTGVISELTESKKSGLDRPIVLMADLVDTITTSTGSKSTVQNGVAFTRIVNGETVYCGCIDILMAQKEASSRGDYSSENDVALFKDVLKLKGDATLEGVCSNPNAATSFDVTFKVPAELITSTTEQATASLISSMIEDLVNKGFEEQTVTEIKEYLMANNFTIDEVKNIFKSYKTYDDSVKWRIPRRPEILFTDEIGALRTCYACSLNNFHILLTGDKGVGKNCLIRTWAWVLQRPLYEISINRETDKIDALGSKTLESSIDEKTQKVIDKIEFKPEVLLEAMENGGIIDVDEINFADPGVTALFHSICDDRRQIEVPGYKKVVADDNFFMMATMNVDYQGTNELNEALADRFVDIVFPANDSIQSVLTIACPSAPIAEIKQCDQVYMEMYQSVESRDNTISKECLTVRGFIQALSLSKVLGLKKALYICVADKIKDAEYNQNIKTIIQQKVR